MLLQQLRVVRGEELHREPQDGVFGSCTKMRSIISDARRSKCRNEVGRRGAFEAATVREGLWYLPALMVLEKNWD